MKDHSSTHTGVVGAPDLSEWEGWLNRVEDIQGHSTDGELAVDGYSLASYFKMWKQGWSPEAAASSDSRAHRDALLTPDPGGYRGDK